MGRNKNRNKGRKHSGSITAHGQRTLTKRGASSATSSVEDTSTTSSGKSTPIEQARDASPASPKLSDQAPIDQNGSSNQKRDSVISNTWDDSTRKGAAEPKPTIRSRWRLRPSRWWPCRACRWAQNFGVAVIRGLQGPRALDLILTLGLAFAVMFAGYVGVELVLGLLRGVEAQAMISRADCSVVYVTVPGPIITVSLIAVSPSNPARGTYYFSVVNGTTEWMNSIAPPSRFSTLITKTPEVTPVISSLPAIPAPISTQPKELSTPGVLPPAPVPPLLATTFTTTSLLGTSLITTTITSQLPGNIPPPSTKSSRGPIGEPLRPWPTPVVPSSSSVSGPLPGAPALSSSIPGPPVSSPGAPNPITSSSSSIPSSSLGPQVPLASAPSIISNSAAPATSSISIVVTSTLPGGQTTTQTLISATTLIPIPPSSSSAAIQPTTSDVLIVITNSLPGGATTVLTSTSTTILNAPSGGQPALPSTSSGLTTLTSTYTGGSTTRITPTVLTTYNSRWSNHHLNKHISGGYQPIKFSSSAEPKSSINIKRSGPAHKHNTCWGSYNNHVFVNHSDQCSTGACIFLITLPFAERVISGLEPHTKRRFHSLAIEPLL
ncbi:hypothetical protein BKA63DRAFT_561925 [Paraphoma chrysanthemicola]|nr:hypothetical protein BKA63DRAFT_561925 [Paraphoma chrysanthemicola]